jgi:CDP-diacylglycerol--glycerol-3-phosphate 3-phosphatidyltransferase
LFDGRWRTGVERGLEPVGTSLRRTGISADHLTAAGLVLAAAAAVVIGAGWLVWGVVLLTAAALPDLLDGAVAKASGTASTRGAFFDSVADRVTDSLVLGGVAWYLATSRPGSRVVILAVAVLASSSLISYQRAKAESLGLDARGGLMERAERIILLAIGLAFSVLLIPVLWILLGLTLLTAGQRFVKVWRQASAPPEVDRPVSRWRTWRPLSGAAAGDDARRRRRVRRTDRPRPSSAWRRRAHTRP